MATIFVRQLIRRTLWPVSSVTIEGLRAFLDDSPSPWHAVATAAARLDAAGFAEYVIGQGELPAAGYIRRRGALIAFRRPGAGIPRSFHIVGAHTDSPGLRVKPHPDLGSFGWRQLGVEIYGGVLLNSWLDRDLGIAGQLALANGDTVAVRVDRPICRVPQLAIHLDREVNDKGLILDRQVHMLPVWGTGTSDADDFASWISDQAGVDADELRAWDLCLYDLTPATVLGSDGSLLASGRLDNLASCWAAITALVEAGTAEDRAQVVALFDHEEVGSASTTGAAGPILEHVLERLVLAGGGGRADLLDALTRSLCISADNAHAIHPNYPGRHDQSHAPLVNLGPAIKLNANQRYATDSLGAARVQDYFEQAGIAWQTFVSNNAMPCGSTIGPITATRLGIDTVDVGIPQLSMHSARELCGTADPPALVRGLTQFL